MTMRRIIKWVATLGALGISLVVFAALLLPRVLDTQTAQERIRAYLSTRTNGSIVVDHLELTWFPRPAVVARGAALSVEDTCSGTIESIEVYPSIWRLLAGQMHIARVAVTRPVLSVRLLEPGNEPFDEDATESRIRSLLASLAAHSPGLRVTVSRGSVELKIGERPALSITDMDGRLLAPPGALDLQLRARATVFDSVRVEARIAAETLATTGRVRIENLRLREALTVLAPSSHAYIESGTLQVDLWLTSVGLRKVRAEIEGALPSLGLVRANRKTIIEGGAFKGVISRDERKVDLVIARLDIAAPRLPLTGGLTVDRDTGAVRLKLAGRDVDVARIRESALQLAADVRPVATAFRYVGAGTVTEITIETGGASLADMWSPDNLVVAATKRGGSLFLPGADLHLDDVSGAITVSGGMLEAKGFSARLGKIRGRDGVLRLGLEGPDAPFHLDMLVQADAAELQSLLLRLVKNDGFQSLLSRLQNVAGTLSGRLVLGETIDTFVPTVSVLRTALRYSYELFPYPLSITRGRFDYGDGKAAFEDVSGTVGLSSFTSLTGSLRHEEPRRIEIASGKFSLDVAETTNLLNHLRVRREELREIEFARGTLELASMSLAGPLDDPGRWEFSSAGTFGTIAMRHAKLPGVLHVSGGTFRATPAGFSVSGAPINVLDASLTLDGFLERRHHALLRLDCAAAGSIGSEAAGWLRRQMELPEQFMLRSPLQVTKGHVVWEKDRHIGFRGDLSVAGGPQLFLDLIRLPNALNVKEIRIADGERRARVTFDLAEDRFAFSFNGAIEQGTLDRIFQVPPPAGSLIEGDIDIRAALGGPIQFAASGWLAGKGVRLPPIEGHPVVESFSLEADDHRIAVRSADVRWRNSRLSLAGTVRPETTALRVDLDLSADRLVWDEIRAIGEGGGDGRRDEGTSRIPVPPVAGTIRLKADTFTFAGFNWTPLHATALLSPEGVRGTIERGDVCGIGMVGAVNHADGEIGLDLTLSVTDRQLEATSLCLTDNRHAITGRYSLQAQVAGRGSPETVARALRGGFDLQVQDGRVVQLSSADRHSILGATFDYLNATDDFSIAFPDLHAESFPFRSLTFRGEVEGLKLVNNELALQSQLFILTGDGTVDLEHQSIDARGLVSVRMPGGSVLKRLPLVGSVFGGSMLGIPVRVAGSLDDPKVTYLAPADVGAQLLRIPLRVLGLPREAIRLFTPGARVPDERR